MTALHESFLYREIFEQPQTLERLFAGSRASIRELTNAISQLGIQHVLIAARGTSDNAGRYAQYLFGARNRLLVTLATPSLFSIYHCPPALNNTLVLAISQSGRSPDILAVVEEGNRQGALTAAITNFPDSELGKQARHVISLYAGEEHSLAATKTYTNSLAALALISAELAKNEKMLAALAEIPEHLPAVLGAEAEIAAMTERYRYMDQCVVIGRGYNYATAFELSLKLKELTYTIAEPYSSADFLHGPFALVSEGFPVIAVSPSGMVLPKMMSFLRGLRQHGAELVIISDEDEALRIAHRAIRLPPGIPEWLSPLVAIVPGQLFAMHLAATRGYDVDNPRSLTKVTRTL